MKLKKIVQQLAKGLMISGPFNIQALIPPSDDKGGGGPNVLVIETNVRASRSLPFISKVTERRMNER